MKSKKPSRKQLIAMTMLALAASLVHAHGDAQHVAKPFNAAEAEQKDFGIAGDPRKAARTIRLAMSDDMRFSPHVIEITQGETVKFVVANKGKMLHELVIGTPADLQEHAALMKKFPDMEHDEPHMVHVKPGKSEQLAWTFNRPGEFDFACLIPGHFDAGMTGKIVVREKRSARK